MYVYMYCNWLTKFFLNQPEEFSRLFNSKFPLFSLVLYFTFTFTKKINYKFFHGIRATYSKFEFESLTLLLLSS